MKISNREIIRGHAYLYLLAEKAYRNGDFEKAVDYIYKYSNIANAGNWIYHNPKVVNLLERIARIYSPEAISTYQAEPMRVVFYDQYGISFVLALQYVRALANNGYEVLYLLSDYHTLDDPNSILQEMEAHPHVHVHIVDDKQSLRDRMREIVDTTIAYKPTKIFMHVRDCSAFNFAISVIPNCCDVYYINQHDHAFWIKSSRIDYCIPYRAWGATIDIEKRGFKPEQELIIPYYPIINTTPFQGFPEQTKGKVIIFTGGTQFKTYDNDNTFWNLVVRILLENPDAVILYAIKGDVNKRQLNATRQLTLDDAVLERLIPIGFRTDINEVFKHCDIFLGTCPMSGGLMSQYAAVNAKPILQYYPPRLAANNETEQVLDYNGKEPISFTELDLFMQEAKHLIDDSAYRKQRGEAIQKCLITQPQFDELLVKTIETNQNQVPYERTNIDYDAFAEWWLSMEKWGFSNYSSYIMSLLKNKKYYVMPYSTIKKRMAIYLKRLLEISGYYKIKYVIRQHLLKRKYRREDNTRRMQYAKAISAIDKRILPNICSEYNLTISLTSHGNRLEKMAPYAIFSILKQTRLPNRIVLNINQEEWNDENIPAIFQQLRLAGLEINYCRDVGPHTKFLPTLSKYPDDVIITIDDDIIYPTDMIESLYKAYITSDNKTVLCRSGRIVNVDRDGKLFPYSQWDDTEKCMNEKNKRISPCGVSGVLYPPHIFSDEIFHENVYRTLCKGADDIWFTIMEIRDGIDAVCISYGRRQETAIDRVNEYYQEGSDALHFANNENKKNDAQLELLKKYYKL